MGAVRAIAAVLIAAWAVLGAAGTGPVTVKLIAFNDLHGYLDPPAPINVPRGPRPVSAGGVAWLAGMVDALGRRNPYHVVVGAGDMVGASPLESARFHDESTIETLNALGLEFTAVGNHEFDHGRAELQRLQNGGCAMPRDDSTCQLHGRFDGARFRYLAANVIDESSGRSFFPGYAVKHFDVAGRDLKIGFIGLVLRQTPGMVPHAGIRGLHFTDEAAAANALVPELWRQGVHAIVVLIHQGVTTEGGANDPDCPGAGGELLPIMARFSSRIGLVISGHTHQAYVCRAAETHRDTPLLYTSAGSYGRYVTDIDLALNPDSGEIVSAHAENRLVANDRGSQPLPATLSATTADAAVSAIVGYFDARVAALKSRALGRIGGDFTRTQTPAGESTLGDLVADAQLAATAASRHGGAVIAFTNIGGLRADLIGSSGRAVTFGDVFAAQPFNNTLITLTLSGAQIKAVLEQQWRAAGTARVLQASRGFHYRWSAHAALGDRIDAASMTLGGARIKADGVYRVTVNNYLADGGDGFAVLRQGSDRTDSETPDADALADYICAHPRISPSPLDRIRRVD
jgi:5'-nucleotidase